MSTPSLLSNCINTCLVAAAAVAAIAMPATGQEAPLARTLDDAGLAWGPCPPVFPAGCEIAVLHGDTAKPNADVFFKVPANYSILERTALLLQQQLGAIGVRVRLESLPPDVFTQRIMSGQFDAAVNSILSGPSATVFHRFWHSADKTRRWNFWGYRNAAVDAALDAALAAASDGEFSEAIRQFEAAARDDPPAIFLAWNETVQAVSRRFVVPADGAGRDAIYALNRWSLRKPGSPAP